MFGWRRPRSLAQIGPPDPPEAVGLKLLTHLQLLQIVYVTEEEKDILTLGVGLKESGEETRDSPDSSLLGGRGGVFGKMGPSSCNLQWSVRTSKDRRRSRSRSCRIGNGQIRDLAALRRKRGLANISERTLPTFWDCKVEGGEMNFPDYKLS